MCTDEILDTYHILKAGLNFQNKTIPKKQKNKPPKQQKTLNPFNISMAILQQVILQVFHTNYFGFKALHVLADAIEFKKIPPPRIVLSSKRIVDTCIPKTCYRYSNLT